MRSAMAHRASPLRTGPYDPPGATVGNSRGGAAFGGSLDRGGRTDSDRDGAGSAGRGVGATDSADGAGRLIAPPPAFGVDRGEGGDTACEVLCPGSNTGGSSSTVYSRRRRPRDHVASTSSVTNGSVTGSREDT